MTNLSGESSIFPYGLDTFEFQDNYESSDVDERGDLIRANTRNHMADSVLKIEAELSNVVHSYTGDLYISCATARVTGWDIRNVYSVTTPADVMSFLIGAGTSIEQFASPVVVQMDARPVTHFQFWQDTDYRGAMQLKKWFLTNTAYFTILDPFQKIVTTQPDYTIGDFILSVIFFRQA